MLHGRGTQRLVRLMMGERKLSTEQEALLGAHGARGRKLWASGNVTHAEEAFLAAWNVVPEPQLEYDYAQSLARGLVIFYRDTAQYEKARKWLLVTEQSYGDGNPSVDFLGGTVAFRAGEFDEAFRLFDKLFRAYGERPFKGEDRAYLDFYRSRQRAH